MMTARTDRPLTGPFWAAVDRHVLVRPVCAGCGRSHFSPQVVCPWCSAAGWTYQPSSGCGTVASHTTVHRPPDPSFDAPYVVIDVELDEGWRMFSWLVNCDAGTASIGLAVQVAFIEGPDGQTLPAFEPRDGASG